MHPTPRGFLERALRAAAGVGALVALAAGCSETDDRPFAWGYISPVIFQPSCATAGCHSRTLSVAGLDFSDPARGYASLTAGTVWVPGDPAPDAGCQDVNGTTLCPHQRALVVPYNPNQSRLVNMLRARAAPRMPPDRPLSEADIRLVERWILDGAPRTFDPNSTPPPAPVGDGGSDDADIFDASAGDGADAAP